MTRRVGVQIKVIEAKFSSKLKRLRHLTHNIEVEDDEGCQNTPVVKFYEEMEFILDDR